MSKLRAYYYLTKPGIVRSNTLTAFAGYLFAAERKPELATALAVVAGVCLVIASACVFNNYLDRRIDAKMARTKKRALVTGKIKTPHALAYGTVLGAAGFACLILGTNTLTTLLGVLAIFSYVVVYGYAKRNSVHGTLVGTLPGGLPPVAGYAAATNQVDMAALLLFLIMVFWQMAHFYAIAIFRKDEYAAAKVPVRSIVSGVPATQRQILYYIAGLLITLPLLSVFGYAGVTYAATVTVLAALWLYKGITKLPTTDPTTWAKQMFGYSLLMLTTWSLLLCVEVFLP